MESIAILVFKWIFVAAAIWLSFYHYRREIRKINILSRQLDDSMLIKSLKSSARSRMLHFLIFFSAFIVWILAYDLVNQDVTRQNTELSQELQEASVTYANLMESQQRLVSANQGNVRDVIRDTQEYYTEILTNYYVMRKCKLAGDDDIFIINSALMRELSLNGIPASLRDQIFKSAKTEYSLKYINFDCNDLQGRFNDIIDTYQNYIIAVKEILSATF